MKSQQPLTLTPEALRLMAKMQRMLAQDGIHVTINEPESHLHLIDIAEKFSDAELRRCGTELKAKTIYSSRLMKTLQRMQSILSNDGINIDLQESNAIERLIAYSENFKDKELKKLGKQLKTEFSST